MAIQSKVKRKHIRYTPDPDDYALILTGAQGRPLKNPKICLLIQESFGGCMVVMTQDKVPAIGLALQVQVGRQSAMKAEVRWSKVLSPRVFSVGLKYLTEE